MYVYTDGACKGGVGGWGFHYMDGYRREFSGGEEKTTNNRMELTAVIRALESLRDKPRITIISDSNYVIRGATEWLSIWKQNGWKNARKQGVANRDLWVRLDALLHDGIKWEWVKSHNGDAGNIIADQLANQYFIFRK